MATVPDNATQPEVQEQVREPGTPAELRIYSHSMFFYWWPVWLTGYVMALLTYVQGVRVTVGDAEEIYHPNKNVGVTFVAVLLTVILFTNVSLRGKASVIAILAVMFTTVTLAYFNLWDDILAVLPYLTIRMNLGFYVFFSTLLLAAWLFTVFVYDHLSVWRVTPGQMTFGTFIGGGQRSYDTRGMVFEKRHEDFFRHWLLGLGSGDLHMITVGARREEITIPNVLFVDRKIRDVQRLISLKPETLAETPA